MEAAIEAGHDAAQKNLSQEDVRTIDLPILATARPQLSDRSAGGLTRYEKETDEEGKSVDAPRRSQNCFSSLQWTPDGTTLLMSSNANRQLDTYILPPDLLTSCSSGLSPYNSIPVPSPLSALAIHPHFNLSEPSSCLYLAAPGPLPIRLVSPFTPHILATYSLYNEVREQWLKPHCLLFPPKDPGIFYAGKENEVCVFDVNRSGEGPCGSIPTGRRKVKKKTIPTFGAVSGSEEGAGTLRRGLVSAMAVNMDGQLAVGTFTGEVGLLDAKVESNCAMLKLPLPGEAGSGVTGLKFHPDPSRQSYLVVGSRRSETLEVLDVRNTESALASLEERCAMTQQRLGFDVTETGEVWAGGTDGFVRLWTGLGQVEGSIQPTNTMKAHDDAVSGCELHPGGAGVLATCAGSRKSWDPDAEVLALEDEADDDASLKIWNLRP